MDITELTVHELIEKIKNKELTVTEINQAYIDRINLREKDIQAFITVLDKEALERSKNISNNLSELAGIPIGIKDNICTKNIKTTCASKMLENFVSPYDATVVERLENKGLINIGKSAQFFFPLSSLSTGQSSVRNDDRGRPSQKRSPSAQLWKA